jgi:hypothetical protein
VWLAVGAERGDEALAERGRQLVEEAAGLRADLERAMARSTISFEGLDALPLIAGASMLHVDAPYRSRPEAFDENRVWSELLHSGLLDRQRVEAILAFAAASGGSTLGIFGNRSRVVGFQAAGTAYGLIQHDLIRELLLLYWAHASHCHTRGTWSAFEGIDLDRDRAAHLPYCAPAQLTIPSITKWMLVFEDPQSSTLWLAKATPRTWLMPGRQIAVTRAPTRWGRVAYSVRSELRRGRIAATIDRPEPVAVDTMLRLRVPGQYRMTAVRANDRAWPAFDPVTETVRLAPELGAHVELIASYERRHVDAVDAG